MLQLALRRCGGQKNSLFRVPGDTQRVLRSVSTSSSGTNGKPQIYVIHDEHRYVQPLLREMSKRGVPFTEWNLNATMPSHLFDFSGVPPTGVFYNRISACGRPEHRDVPQLARGILMWLQSHRRHIVNGPESISLTASKMEMQIALEICGIRTPHSIACFDDDQILQAARSFQGKRFMLEPNRRILGEGVRDFYSAGELEASIQNGELIRSADNITVVQEYVKSKAPYVNRVEFVGGRLLYGMHVDVSRGWDRLIPGHHAEFSSAKSIEAPAGPAATTPTPIYQVLPDFDHPMLDKYVEFMDKHGIDIASFEFAEVGDGSVITFDVDICSTFNAAAEYRANVAKAGVGAVCDYLGRLVELERPLRGTQRARAEDEAPEPLISEPALQKKEFTICDGGMGRALRARAPDLVKSTTWSANVLIEDPNLVKDVHLDFIKSGARVITCNNYACTPQFLAKGGIEDKLEELLNTALKLACEARDECGVDGVKVMASLPPLNESYRSDLVLPVEKMLPIYEHMVSVMDKYPIDIIICETMSSKEEAFAAATAASKSSKETWVSWTLRDDLSGCLRSGDSVTQAYRILAGLPVEAFLFNCCVPEAIEEALPVLMRLTDKPVGAMPNCFVPIPTDWTLNGSHGFRETREDMRPMDYAGYMRGWLDKGASIVGGCCGIDPSHIKVCADDLQENSSIDTPFEAPLSPAFESRWVNFSSADSVNSPV